MLFAFLLFAQVVCVDNGDGSWTCSGGFPGVSTNAQGQATCTNCVNMTPQQCRDIKESLEYRSDRVVSDTETFRTKVYDLINYTEDHKSDFERFTDCPYAFNFVSTSPTTPGSVSALVTGSSSVTATNLNNAASILVDGFNSSSQVVDGFLDPVVSRTFNTSQAQSFVSYCWNVASQWHSSYQVAQSVVPVFNQQISDLNSIRSLADSVVDDVYSIRSSVPEITCESCVMSSGGDDSSPGVDAGCAECYLVFLRRYEEQLDLLNAQVQVLTNVQASILQQVENISFYLPAFSNNLQRIDDYLWTDQSNKLANVEAAIIVISNNIDSIQRYYFHSFSNASDITSGDYGAGSPSMEEVFHSIFKPNDHGGFQLSEYQKYDWFRRIELQLSQISGIFSETNVDSLSDSDYNSMKDAVENFEDLSDGVSSSGGSVISVGSSLRSAAQTIGSIFPSSAPLGEITLLEARYWIGDTDLVLRTDFQVVSFCRALFGLIWVTLACVGLWLLLSRSWVILFDIARWFCNWFPKIFGN